MTFTVQRILHSPFYHSGRELRRLSSAGYDVRALSGKMQASHFLACISQKGYIFRVFFENTGIESTEEMKILAYKLISDEIEDSKRNLIKLKP